MSVHLHPIKQVFLSLTLILLFESVPAVVEAKELAVTPHPPALTSYSDFTSSTIYNELKARGVDPLEKSCATALRQAFVSYDFSTGGGMNFETSESSDAVGKLNKALPGTGITSTIRVTTKMPGARVKYRLIGLAREQSLPKLTNEAEDTVSIGLYMFWAERKGIATSKPLPIRVIKQIVGIEIEEVLK